MVSIPRYHEPNLNTVKHRLKRSTKLLTTGILCGVSFSAGYGKPHTEDHLIPVYSYYFEKVGPGAEYRRLWEKKLFVSNGKVARSVYLPADSGTEAVVSIDQQRNKQGSLPGGYWVTTTQPSKQLWSFIPTGEEKLTNKAVADPNEIQVRRCDAPLTESTALAVRRVWLEMLHQTRSLPSEQKSVDSSTEIFSAVDSDGTLLQGQIPIGAKQNTLALFDIANMLAEYCELSPSERPQMAAKIEKMALDLLSRIVPPNKNN